MNVQEIKTIAKQKGVQSGRMKKDDLIRAIQTAEGNSSCYGTSSAGACGQKSCLGRDDCK